MGENCVARTHLASREFGGGTPSHQINGEIYISNPSKTFHRFRRPRAGALSVIDSLGAAGTSPGHGAAALHLPGNRRRRPARRAQEQLFRATGRGHTHSLAFSRVSLSPFESGTKRKKGRGEEGRGVKITFGYKKVTKPADS